MGVYGYSEDSQANGGRHSGEHRRENQDALRELASHIRTRLLFAHIRASTGGPVERSNCHPFRFDKWLFMHNGSITDFHVVRRELMRAIDPSLFAEVGGSMNSETLFYLALTSGPFLLTYFE